MWEASDFQYSIITCEIPSPHNSSLLISLQLTQHHQALLHDLEIPQTYLPGYSDLHYV